MTNNTTKCTYCEETTGIEGHHIWPVSLGGPDEECNIIPVCGKHHGIMHGMFRRSNVSELTKAGLQRARERGVKLGNPQAARCAKIGRDASTKNAKDFANKLYEEHIRDMRTSGMSLNGVAKELNKLGITGRFGGLWTPSAIINILKYIE